MTHLGSPGRRLRRNARADHGYAGGHRASPDAESTSPSCSAPPSPRIGPAPGRWATRCISHSVSCSPASTTRSSRRSTRPAGGLCAGLGLVHAAFAGTALVNVLLLLVHPRMGTIFSDASSAPLLEPPGFLLLNYGTSTPLVMIAVHAVYGALVGAFTAAPGWPSTGECDPLRPAGGPLRMLSRRPRVRRSSSDRGR